MKEWVMPVVQTIGLGVVLPTVAVWLSLHIKNKLMRDALIGVAQRAGGIAYDYLATRAEGLSPEIARKNAFAAGLDYMETAGKPFIAALGVTGTVPENMVRGELGALLAQDSAITVAAQVQPNTTVTLTGPMT